MCVVESKGTYLIFQTIWKGFVQPKQSKMLTIKGTWNRYHGVSMLFILMVSLSASLHLVPPDFVCLLSVSVFPWFPTPLPLFLFQYMPIKCQCSVCNNPVKSNQSKVLFLLSLLFFYYRCNDLSYPTWLLQITNNHCFCPTGISRISLCFTNVNLHN